MGRLTGIPTASVGFFDGSTDLSGGGGTLAPQDVVEFYLQPVSLGTTNYSSDFEMDSSDNISVNNVTTSDASGTIYFDVYAGLNLSGGASSGGVETAELNFTSTGAIGDGSTPSSLGLAFANGFGDGPAASTGDSTDLNDDGNLDLGSTGNANPAGWADFCQNPGVIGTASGSGSGDCTNVLLGVLAYNYSDADDGQTAQVTLDSRTGMFAPVFMYELDGSTKADTFHGCRASDLAIGTPVTITYAPAGGLSQASSDETGTVPLTPSSAARGLSQVSSGGLSQVSSDETGTVPFSWSVVPVASSAVETPLGPTGTVALVVAGSGTLVLSGDNTYSGGTDIESGTLQLGSQDALPTGCAVTVDSAGTLDLDGWSPQIAALSDGPDGGGAVTNGAATAVTLTLAPPSGTPSTFSGTIDDGSNGGAVGLIVDGPGTQILAGSNSYSGPTEIIGGVLQAGAEYALSPSSDVTVGQYGTLDLNGFDNEVNTLAGSGTVENSAARTTATVTVGADDTPGLSDMDTTFSGVLQDVGTGQLALDKTGDDTLTLTNANTYTGETTLDEGTLFVAAGGSIVGPVMIEGGQLDGPDAPTAMGTATTTTLTATDSPWIVGQPVTFTATVTLSGGGPASGWVVFMDGNTVLGTATLDDSGTAVFTTADMAIGDHRISAFYRGSTAEVLLPSGSDAVEHEVNPATPVSLTIDGFSLDDSGELSVQYTIGAGSAMPFTIGIYGSPDGCTPTDLLQTYDAAGSDLTVGDQDVTLNADFGELGAADSYLLAVLDTNDDVYVTSRADVSASLSLADYQAAFQNPDDGNVYVFTGANVAISEDPTTGDETISANGTVQAFQDVSGITIRINQGSDTISAAGVTVPIAVYGGSGSDTIIGGDGGNTIYGGSAGGNTIEAGAGDDTIYGGGGAGSAGNTITGGAGNGIIYAGDGPDNITGGSGDDIIYAGAGDDQIVGGSGNNEIYGGSGSGVLDAGPGRNNWIYGGSGNYKIDGAHYTDCSATSDSNDWLTCGTGDDTVYGGPGNEVITGGSGTDELFGGIGTNEIHSGTGTNYLCPGGQNDVLDGKLGTSTISTDTFSGASVQVQTPVWDFGSQGWVVNNYSNPDGPATSQGLALDAGQNGSVYISGEEASGFPWQFSVDSGARLGENATTPVAVYVCWNPSDSLWLGNHWATDAQYSVYDGSTLLAAVDVNQQNSCPSESPDPSDHPWMLLGVYNITSGTVGVQLRDGNNNPAYGEMLDFNDVMVRPIWPTVSIRADEDGTGQFGIYDDYLNAANAAQIPVEGDGTPRLAVQLSATVDPVYAQMAGASMSDWKAILPNVPGLEFWTAATGGEQLGAVDGSGDLIDDTLPSSGQYTRTVWVSVDPNSTVSADVSQIAFTVDPAGEISVTKTIRAQALSTIPYAYPFSGAGPTPYKPAITSSVQVMNGQLEVTIRKDAGYRNSGGVWGFNTAMRGLNSADPDSAQVALGWEDANGTVLGSDTNATPKVAANGPPNLADTPPNKVCAAAAWTYTAGADESEQVSTVFSINPNATTVQVVVAYTDCLEGTPAEAKKNAQGDPNKSTLGKGDLPLIVGSWTGTLDPATNKWTFTVNTVQISQIQMAMGARYQKRKPTLGELDTWTGWATTAVAQTGCNLKIRNRGGSNTGFDIYK